MKRKYSIIGILFCLLSAFSFAQNVSPSWTGTYKGNGDNSDRFNKIISDGSGNFIGVGYTQNTGSKTGNYHDFLTIKFNSNGDTLWWRTKNGITSGVDEAISAGVDASGNVFVTGFIDAGNAGQDIYTIKYDANGNSLWEISWNSPVSLNDVPVDLKVDAMGNCLIGGIATPDTFSKSSDFITLKYDPNGQLLWSNQFSRSGVANGRDDLAAIALDSLGDVYVTGRSLNASVSGNDDFVTIKYNGLTGTESWMQVYNGGGTDRAVAIVADHSGNVIVTGRSNNGHDDDYRTIKYNSAGNLQWVKTYNSPTGNNDRPTAITVDAGDNVIVTGQSGSLSVNYDFQTIKYNSSGIQQWVVRIGNAVPQDDIPNAIVADGSGNIFITGKTDQNIDPAHTDYDFMTVMYNPSGNIVWGPIYHAGTLANGDDIAYSLVVDGSNLFVAGDADNIGTQKDATVVKYDIATGNVVWFKDYNGLGDFRESAQAVVVDNNKNSYAAGYSIGEATNLNACIVKFDPAGNVACNYLYNGLKNDDDEFTAIAIGFSGKIYAAGYTKVSGQKSNMLLVKWDPATCDTIWTRTYDYINQSDKAVSIVLDAADNIYLTGYSDSDPSDTIANYDIVTRKYDGNGNVLWTQRFNGIGNARDEPKKIILDNSGNVIVGGKSANIHDDDFIIIKYNSSNGSPVWLTPSTWGSQYTNDDHLNDIVVDSSNNIFVCGLAQSSSGFNSTQDQILLKYDSAGTFITGSFFIGDDKDEAVKLAVDINNNVYCLYKTDVNPVPLIHNFNYQLRKFDNQLNELWPNPPQYDSPINNDDVPSAMAISPSGIIYVTGASIVDTSGGHKNTNWITIGYDPQLGSQIFISNYDGPNAGNDSPNALIISENCMWVAGHSEGINNSQKDLTVNNYCNLPLEIRELNTVTTATVFPNPFSSETEIYFDNSNIKSSAFLEIYDMLGNSVASPQLINGTSVRVGKGNLSSGIYEYRIKTNTSLLAHGKLVIN